MPSDPEQNKLINRREAILRVSAMLGGAALVGQSAMLAGCAAQPGHTYAAFWGVKGHRRVRPGAGMG